MQAIETERSPGLPSLMVTTRRRLMPHGTSFSFLQAVTQALHSMQRSASQRNFIRAIVEPPSRRPDLTECNLRLLHACRRVITVGRYRVGALTEHDRIRPGRIFVAQIGTRSEEHTSELQSHVNLVCRLLLEKKKIKRAECS